MKFGNEIVDDVRCVRRNHRRVLVLGVLEIAGHAVAVQQIRQLTDEFRGSADPPTSAQT